MRRNGIASFLITFVNERKKGQKNYEKVVEQKNYPLFYSKRLKIINVLSILGTG
jgi:hypothetical protein